MPRETCFGIFEMGMSAPGELAALTRLVRPHVAIVTAIAPAYRAFFASDEEIADAKGVIFEGREEGGTAHGPFDSPHRDRVIDAGGSHPGTILSLRVAKGADSAARADKVVPSAGQPGSQPLAAAETDA